MIAAPTTSNILDFLFSLLLWLGLGKERRTLVVER